MMPMNPQSGSLLGGMSAETMAAETCLRAHGDGGNRNGLSV